MVSRLEMELADNTRCLELRSEQQDVMLRLS